MSIEVTSVSKKEQKLGQAAAAVYVITQEDIRRSGLTSIPEILRLAPGLQVAEVDRGRWAISARGFNGQFSNKMLVLIDGRTVYTPMTSGVFWDEQDTILEDIDRIEVIRGPGATLWGANAVNGVINIITRPASESLGGLLTAGVGTGERILSGARFGDRIGTRAAFRIYSKYLDRLDYVNLENRRDQDWRSMRAGFRVDWSVTNRDSLTLQGDFYQASEGLTMVATELEPPYRSEQSDVERTGGGNVLTHWRHRASDHSEFTLKAYFDQSQRNNAYWSERRSTVDLDFQHRWSGWSRHELVWGLGFRYNGGRFRGSPSVSFEANHRRDRLFGAFVRDEFHLVPDRVALIFGSRFEHNDFTGTQVQPDLRIVWTPGPQTALWAAVSHAVRTPSYLNADVEFKVAAFPGAGGVPNLLTANGNPGFRPETLRAHEVGYRFQAGKRFSVDWTAFYNVYKQLQTLEPAAPFLSSDPMPLHVVLPLIEENRMRGETSGTEISANWKVTERWRVTSSYSWLALQMHLDPSSRDTSSVAIKGRSPNYQVQFHSNLDLGRHWQLDGALYRVSALPALPVPAYSRFDARLGWRPSPAGEISVGGRNLQGGRHLEFISEGPYSPAKVGRTVFVRLTWAF